MTMLRRYRDRLVLEYGYSYLSRVNRTPRMSAGGAATWLPY